VLECVSRRNISRCEKSNGSISGMALPFVNMSSEERISEWVDRLRRTESWARETNFQQLCYRFGCSAGHNREQLEDILLLVTAWNRHDPMDEEQVKVVATLRQSIRELSEMHKLCFIRAQHGDAACMAMVSKRSDPDLTDKDQKGVIGGAKMVGLQ
jgi:hypothetical protein